MVEDNLDKRTWMRLQPSYGPDWDAAIEYGVDISLIEHALSLTYEERFRESLSMTRLPGARSRAREAAWTNGLTSSCRR